MLFETSNDDLEQYFRDHLLERAPDTIHHASGQDSRSIQGAEGAAVRHDPVHFWVERSIPTASGIAWMAHLVDARGLHPGHLRDTSNRSLFHTAVVANRADLLPVLARGLQRPDPLDNVSIDAVDGPSGMPSLFLAVLAESWEAALCLIDLGADPLMMNTQRDTLWHALFPYQVNTNPQIEQGRLRVAQRLIEAKVPANAKNRDGDTPLHRWGRVLDVSEDWAQTWFDTLIQAGAKTTLVNRAQEPPLNTSMPLQREVIRTAQIRAETQTLQRVAAKRRTPLPTAAPPSRSRL